MEGEICQYCQKVHNNCDNILFLFNSNKTRTTKEEYDSIIARIESKKLLVRKEIISKRQNYTNNSK